jgi:hypothetical protein
MLGRDGAWLKKIGIARDILRPSGVLLAAIKPHRLDGDGQCVSLSVSNRSMVLKGSAEMKHLLASLTIGACLVLPSAGVAFADDLHNLVPSPNLNPGAASAAPGQTGSNVLASCGPTSFPSLGAGAKSNAGSGSPFNPSVTKKYAGNAGNPATNANAVSQYDNACAQAALHAQMP